MIKPKKRVKAKKLRTCVVNASGLTPDIFCIPLICRKILEKKRGRECACVKDEEIEKERKRKKKEEKKRVIRKMVSRSLILELGEKQNGDA